VKVDINKKLREEINARKRVENALHVKNSFLRLLQVAAVAANEAVNIKDAFLPILKEICSYSGWEIGQAYVISKDDANLLEPINVWWFQDRKHFKKFSNVSKKIKFKKGIGLPGRVLANGKPHWIKDVTKDTNFLRTKIAKEMKIKSGIAFPVMVGTKTVAVLVFFTTMELEPDPQFMEIMADVGTQLGRAIERKQAEEMLQKQTKALEQKNIALSEVLRQIELEKELVKDNIIANAEANAE
jgi:transcriptional regulator with GAF, ATPase, and Fis domain